jgi:hypothetical protein
MNNKEKIVKKILFEIIDKLTKDADVYNHNGSLWLINTDSTKWIFEFTKSKTLWYNYNFFRSALKFVSLDVNEGDNQKYITEWFESRYLNINQVKHIKESLFESETLVDDTIQNGVKNTYANYRSSPAGVDDTIQNGVKNTHYDQSRWIVFVEDTIQNGVKRILPESIPDSFGINDAIQNGVKEIQPLPAQDGNMDWGLYYQRRGIPKPHTEYVRDVIEEHHHRRREVLVTIKDGVKETHQDCSNNIARVEGIIRVGKKLD